MGDMYEHAPIVVTKVDVTAVPRGTPFISLLKSPCSFDPATVHEADIPNPESEVVPIERYAAAKRMLSETGVRSTTEVWHIGMSEEVKVLFTPVIDAATGRYRYDLEFEKMKYRHLGAGKSVWWWLGFWRSKRKGGV